MFFWKCTNYNATSNRSNPSIPVANTTNLTGEIEHALLEDDNDFDAFSNALDDHLVHEETQLRKRVRVEDIRQENKNPPYLCLAVKVSGFWRTKLSIT